MAKSERRLYQKNTIGYLLVLLHIALNVVYTIFSLNNMPVDYWIGIFIIITIAMLLLGFLTAVKVQSYSMVWSFAAVLLGIFQLSRLLFAPDIPSGSLNTFLFTVLIVSAVLCFAGGVISIRESRTRKKLVKQYNKDNDYGIE